MNWARENGYKKMYLDTISSESKRAINLYQRLGFKEIEPYHEAKLADLFMECSL